jgi:hypothetical protein
MTGFRRHTGIGYRFVEEEKDRIIILTTLNIKKMANYSSTKKQPQRLKQQN